ncbi:hypothetical protein HPY42_00140 [Coprothermobacteraceae bacterium]|nr:hypothetical protein [Coprothermobacteraceae bacterium]
MPNTEERSIRAKINLTLDITGKSENLHTIKSIFLKIPLEAKGVFWREVGLFRIEDLDLPYRECKAYKTYLKRPCSVHVTKSIPTGYGLGGSAGDDALISIYTGAEPTARDSYFLISPYKMALVEADQTMITPLVLPFDLELMLVLPQLNSLTSDLYARWDEEPHYTNYTDVALMALQNRDRHGFEDSFGNVFERYLTPELQKIKEYLLEYGPFVMTGSGSAFFAPLRKVKKYPDLPFKILLIERWSPSWT